MVVPVVDGFPLAACLVVYYLFTFLYFKFSNMSVTHVCNISSHCGVTSCPLGLSRHQSRVFIWTRVWSCGRNLGKRAAAVGRAQKPKPSTARRADIQCAMSCCQRTVSMICVFSTSNASFRIKVT